VTGSPAVAVLIPAFNSEKTIVETLASLAAQTRTDWEAVVVDDGSTDRTAEVASEWADRDSRVRVVRKRNGGTASARNVAAKASSAPLLCLLDADDFLLPDYIDHMLAFIDAHPEFDIYSADGYRLLEDGSTVPETHYKEVGLGSFSVEDMLVRNRLMVHNVFRREVFDAIGGFDEDVRIAAEDYDFWLRAMLDGARHLHNPERLRVYRIWAGQKTADLIGAHDADIAMLEKLLSADALSPEQRQIAQASVRRLSLVRADLKRTRLQDALARREFTGARRTYWESRLAWRDRRKFAAGLIVMLVSPRVFAWLLPQMVAPAAGDGPSGTTPAREA
jgi:glycosyltransferase involved in cell wall biosynthesis